MFLNLAVAILLKMDFSVLKPDVGQIFWSAIFFVLFWILIGKSAFKPISEALKKRENDIQGSLDEAKTARAEMANLKSENEALLAQAKEERAAILKEAKEAKNTIIDEARETAKAQAKEIVNSAKAEIENLKMEAVTDLKNRAGIMAVDIAEQIVKKELAGNQEHTDFVGKLVKEFDI